MIATEFKNIIINYGLEYFGRFYGVYRAICADNEDDENRGRIKVECADIFGEDISEWCLPMGLPSGDSAFWILPKKGETVWLMFEGGNVKHGVWSHGWFKDGAAPTEGVNDIVLQSSYGHRIELMNDTILIKHKNGTTVNLTNSMLELNGDSEKAVLGDQLKTVLENLIDIIKVAPDTIGNVFNPAAVLQLEAWKLQLNQVLSKKVKLD